jgi:predicted aspartyl protease
VICTPVATHASTQFVLDVDCNGVKVRIMYDTGASISFARPGLVVGSIEAAKIVGGCADSVVGLVE